MFGLRVHGRAFLRDFIAASREAGMKPFLMWGTLLGHVREGRLLKHDKDLDMGILAADWPKRHVLIEAMQKRGYRLLDAREYKIVFERRDRLTRMDIDVFLPWEDKMVCFSRQRDGSFRGAWFRSGAFKNFCNRVFLDSEVLIPDPPEPILEAIYGDWRTPIKSYDSAGIPNRLALPATTQLPLAVDAGNSGV
jgi:phosphorylcholine metabolism protein LicD